MDSVAAQPSPPVGSSTRNSAIRLAHFLKPLRKSSSSRDLQHYPTYEDYAQHSNPISPQEGYTSPVVDSTQHFGQRSSAFSYTPPTSFGFTSNKARISRALAEGGTIGGGERGGDGYRVNDRDFIPYRGPISPPSTYPSTFSQQQGDDKGADRRLFLHPDKHHQYLPPTESSPLMSHSNSNSNIEWLEKENRSSKSELPRYKDAESNLLGLGLGVGQSDGTKNKTSNTLDTAATTKNRSFLGSGLPSAYTHGGNAPAVESSTTPRTVANQSYLPSLLRFDPGAVERNVIVTRPREVNLTNQGSTASRQTLASVNRKSTSASSSPVMTVPPLMRQSNSADRPSHTKAGSITSSDGHGSSLIHEGSASTSMTSLRDQSSLYGKYRANHEAPSLRASTKNRPRANTTSSAGEKGKGRLDEVQSQHPTLLTRDFVYSQPNDSSQSAFQRTSHSSDLPAKYRLNEIATTRPLSPISGSTPGHQQNDFSPSLFGGSGIADNRQSLRDPIESKKLREKRDSRMMEAQRNYLLLQQLHLDELVSHSTDYAGYLDTKNGCERVMMPRPSLRGRESYQQSDRESQGSTPAVAFERHRRLQTKSSPQLYDAVRAQEILGSNYNSLSPGRTDHTLLFHHRMPPPTPDKQGVQFALPSHVKIPPRRSSQSRRRGDNTAPSTPALTPNLRSEGEDDDDDEEEDNLHTVLAQGRALEEEREQWREQYRRSIGKSKSHGTLRARHRDGTVKKVRYDEKPLPDLGTLHRHAGTTTTTHGRIRPAKSSPDLRKSAKEWDDDFDDASPRVSNKCMSLQSMIVPSRGRTNKRNSQQTRSRSQDPLQQNSPTSHANSCLPTLTRRRRAKTLTSEDEKTVRRRMSQAQLDVYGYVPSSRTPRNAISQPILMSDEPVVIGRQNQPPAAQEVASRQVQSSGIVDQQTRSPNSDAFGIAFSAPRPDIGQSAAPKDRTFLAGRHATKLGYHRPTNSDDLRAMLSSHPNSAYSSDDGGYQEKQQRKIVRKEPPKYPEFTSVDRPTTTRSDSLGMNQARQSIDDSKQTTMLLPAVEVEQKSLPVPPRRHRSSQAITSSLSPVLSSEVMIGDNNRSPAPQFATPFVAMEGFSGSSAAFGTPTLAQLSNADREKGSFFSGQEGKEGVEKGIRESMQSNRSSEEERVAGPLQHAQQQSKEKGKVEGGTMRSRALVSSSSSEDSNYSPRSVAARELWNTDEHAEESFSGLFFRNPSAGNSGLRQIITMKDEADTSRSELDTIATTPKAKQKSRKVAGEMYEDMPISSTGSDRTYRTSLQGRRNSDEVEKVVGNYLHDSSGSRRGGDESFEAAFNEPAWNDSNIDVHLGSQQRREEARMGRIDRRPMIQPAYHAGGAGGDDVGDEDDGNYSDDGETLRRGKSRARLLSFAASLVLTGEGNGHSPSSVEEEKKLPTLE